MLRLKAASAWQQEIPRFAIGGGSTIGIGIIASAIAVVTASAWVLASELNLEADQLVAMIRDFGVAGVIVFIAAMVVSILIGPIPTAPFAIAAGALYGPALGIAIAIVGGLLGAAAAFLIARKMGEAAQVRRLSIMRWASASDSHCSLFWLIVSVRLVPVISFALVSYGAGLTSVSLRGFLVATALGMAPMTTLCVVTGSSLPLALH